MKNNWKENKWETHHGVYEVVVVETPISERTLPSGAVVPASIAKQGIPLHNGVIIGHASDVNGAREVCMRHFLNEESKGIPRGRGHWVPVTSPPREEDANSDGDIWWGVRNELGFTRGYVGPWNSEEGMQGSHWTHMPALPKIPQSTKQPNEPSPQS